MSVVCTTATGTSALDVQAVRGRFPIFANQPGVVLLDNAATSQKPQSVIETLKQYYETSCANAGRSSYQWATRVTHAIEETRKEVAEFLAADAADIAFTGGATDSLNGIAAGWGLANLKDGDEVMLCLQDHKSAVLPWVQLQKTLSRFGIEIKIVPFYIHEVGDYDLSSVRKAVSPRTRVLAMSHVHHLFGLEMEVAEIRQIVGDDVVISLDCSQSVGHVPVLVSELPVDFISFSGHKMFAANGVGVLWASKRAQQEMHHVRVGGKSTVSASVDIEDSEQATLQEKLEAGTLNIPAIMTLSPAIRFIKELGINAIEQHVSDLTKHLYFSLANLPGIEFAPGVGLCGCPGGYGIISFRFQQAETADVGFLLDNEQIFVRTGDHCVTRPGEGDDFLRVSMHVYNTKQDVDRLIEVLTENL